MDERKILEGVLDVMNMAESMEADLGPREYLWLMLTIINLCTMRIANRTGVTLEN